MFSIYGTTGRVFTGSLEQLRRVPGVGQGLRVAPVDDREITFVGALDDAGRPLEREPGGNGHGHGATAARRDAVAAAAAAYAPGGEVARHRITTVAELMSHEVLLLPADVPLRRAWQLLSARGVAQAPVRNAAGGLVGLARLADLAPPPLVDPSRLTAFWAQPVSARMRTPVPAVAAATDVRRLAQVLAATGLPGLPVVDEGGQVQGYIGRGDLMRALSADPPLDLWA
ncbi:CBS domain-containing protein [Aquabacterium sp. OR-4]|uniref:CBS domain-containing protein n=1 Tax=Aquabacterium sp. OR-4 TaxID=2978127 RepID=UPI0021B4ADF9|nr:CBS domain-containing protein [Aquabacterium sp. OR-4]MDT7836766.1 CBS domain-containing protein [Aquabacterium sp. OR-4]